MLPIKIIALALGVAGWVTYSMIWLGVRIFGSVTLTFGKWGPGWLEWLELWIEPVILLGWLAFLVWVLWREINSAGDDQRPNASRLYLSRIPMWRTAASKRGDKNSS